MPRGHSFNPYTMQCNTIQYSTPTPFPTWTKLDNFGGTLNIAWVEVNSDIHASVSVPKLGSKLSFMSPSIPRFAVQSPGLLGAGYLVRLSHCGGWLVNLYMCTYVAYQSARKGRGKLKGRTDSGKKKTHATDKTQLARNRTDNSLFKLQAPLSIQPSKHIPTMPIKLQNHTMILP